MKKITLGIALFCWLAGLVLDEINVADPVISEPLFILGGASVLPLIVLLFLNRSDVYASWARLALWWLPLSVIIILFAPDGSLPPIAIKREFLIWSLGVIFTLISFVLIILKSVKRP